MMHFIDFQCFSNEDLRVILQKIREGSTEQNRLIEWTPKLGFICKYPDLTLIHAQSLSWAKLAETANAATGHQVVLLGDDMTITLGLPTLSPNFTVQELTSLIPSFDRTSQNRNEQRRHPDIYEVDYKATMPMPV